MARALMDGALTPQSFSEKAIRDSAVLELAAKIRGVADPEIDAAFPAKKTAIVSITDVDGITFTEKVDHAKGSPQNPASDAEIRAKFNALTHMLSNAKREKIVSMIEGLETVADFGSLMSELRVD
jgi:2-methylcitrate dehydratase PrpD